MDIYGIVFFERAADDGHADGLPEIQPCLVASYRQPVSIHAVPLEFKMRNKFLVAQEMAHPAFHQAVANDLASDIHNQLIRV